MRNYSKKRKLFPLSKAGKLSAVVALNLAGFSAHSVQAEGIKPVDQQITVKTYGQGTAVVDIATPHNGLSHNKYTDYNVSAAGAVLNNAKQQTNSVILKQLLDANPNLAHSNAADVILNEVVSQNPSSLLGKQEVLGKSADLILANPNGITCDGCGFINTNKAGLVVGKADVQDNHLQGFSVESNNTLTIGAKGLSSNNALDLIAPKIESNGNIQSEKDLRVTLGHNYVNKQGEVVKDKKPTTSQPQQLDSYFFGGMRAGTIKLVSTDAGSGVNLRGNIRGGTNLSVDANGKLVLEGVDASAGTIELSADSLDAQAKVDRRTRTIADKDNYSRYYGAKNAHTTTNYDVVDRTLIVGKNISVKTKGDARFKGTTLYGRNIDVNAGAVVLDNQVAVTDKKRIDDNWYYSWVKNSHIDTHSEEVIGSEISGSEKVKVTATSGDILLTGGKLKGDQGLTVTAKGNIELRGQITHQLSSNQVYRKNHTSSLRSGTSKDVEVTHQFTQSSLQSKQSIGLQAGGDVLLHGVNVIATQDVVIDAGKGIDISSEKNKQQRTLIDNYRYWGGIGGGADKNNQDNQESITRTTINAGQDLLLSGGKNIDITASQVTGGHQGLVQSLAGKVTVDSIITTIDKKVNQRNGTAFNITSSSENSHTNTQQSVGSEVKSNTNLKIVGSDGITISGSILSTAGELGLSSIGDINLTSVATTQQLDSHKTDLRGQATATQTDRGQYQYQASVGIVHTNEHEVTTSVTHSGSSVNAGQLSINSQSNVGISGSSVQTTGNAEISAKNIAVTDVTDTTATQKDSQTVSVGIGVEGGAEKSGVALNVGVEKNKQQLQDSRSQGSSISTGGDLTVTAQNQLTNRGTTYQSGGAATFSASQIDNQAAQDSHTETNDTLKVGVTLGVNADYGAVTRPLIAAAEKVAKEGTKGIGDAVNGVVQAFGPNNGNTKTPMPNAGAEIDVGVTNSTTSTATTTAKTTQIQAGSVSATANQIHDQATSYSGQNGVEIKADSYTNQAVANTSSESSNVTSGSGHLRVYTTTGKDINGDASGQGQHSQSQSSSSTAVTGSIQAQNGDVTVATTNGATFEGTQISAKNGTVALSAEQGNVDLKQATNSQTHSRSSYNAMLGVKAGTSPDGKSAGGSIGGGYQTENSSSTTAVVSTLDAKNTQITAGGNARLEGTQLNATGGTVAINAKQDVEITQVTNTSNSSSRNYQGHLVVNQASNHSDESTGRNLAGRADGTYATSDKSQQTGVAGSINGADKVTITAGNNVKLEGTGIGNQEHKVGDVAIQAGNGVELSATTSTSQEHSVDVTANVNGFNQHSYDQEGSNGKRNLGSGVQVNYVDQRAKSQAGGTIQSSGQVSVSSQGQSGIAAQGTQISGENTVLTANNGGITLSATENTEQHTKVGVGVDVAKGKVETTTSSKQSNVEADSHSYDKSSFGAEVHVDVGNSSLHTNATVASTGSTTLTSQNDVTLAGARVTGTDVQVTSQTGGVTVESKQDSNHQTKVDVEFNHRNNEDPNSSLYGKATNGIKSAVPGKDNKEKVMNKVEEYTGKAKDKLNQTLSTDGEENPSLWKKAAQWVAGKVGGALTSPLGKKTEGGVNVKVVSEDLVNQQAGIEATNKLTLNANSLDLTAAKVTAPAGEVNVDSIKTQDLSRQKHNVEVGLKGTSSVGGLVTQAIGDATKGKVPLVTVSVENENGTTKSEVSNSLLNK